MWLRAVKICDATKMNMMKKMKAKTIAATYCAEPVG